MCRQVKWGRLLIFVAMSTVIAGEPAWASDLSEWLWGGRGSRTTVTDPYIPPPLVTETASIPGGAPGGLATTQSNLMLGTPGAMTLPPGGVIASNGIVTTGGSSTAYVIPSQLTTASHIIPAAQVRPQQPVIEYEWTYSTIKDITYEPATVFDPWLGGYVTTMQEKQTESVFPWLHRKQVVRYKPATDDTITGSPTFDNTTFDSTSSPAVSDPSGRHIVNRLFPVSTVPSPPAQAVPVQAPVQTFPLYAGPMTTYAAESTVGTRIVASGDPPVGLSVPVQPTESIVMRIDGESPLVTAGPSDVSSPAVSSPFDLTPQPYSTTIVSPSAHQVLYPVIPEIGVSSSAINTTGQASGSQTPASQAPGSQTSNAVPAGVPSDTESTGATSGNVPTITSSPVPSPTVSPAQTPLPTAPAAQPTASQRSTPATEPTLAPERSAQPSGTSETVQRPTIQDSLSDSERPQPVEVPPGQPLPPPAQSSPIPSIATPSTGDDIPLLIAPDAESTTQPATQPATQSESQPATQSSTPVRARPDLSNSPTRMPPRMSPLSN